MRRKVPRADGLPGAPGAPWRPGSRPDGRFVRAENGPPEPSSAAWRRTRADSLWDVACSNREHDTAGLRRTNADKQRAVRMALEARPELSNRAIAEQVGVSDPFVGKLRPQVLTVSTSDRRIGADGKSDPATCDQPECLTPGLHYCPFSITAVFLRL